MTTLRGSPSPEHLRPSVCRAVEGSGVSPVSPVDPLTFQTIPDTTRRSLLPDPTATEDDRTAWAAEADLLRRAGVGA